MTVTPEEQTRLRQEKAPAKRGRKPKAKATAKASPKSHKGKVKESRSKTGQLRKSKSKKHMDAIEGDTPGSKRKETKGLKGDKKGDSESNKGKGSGGKPRGRPPTNPDDGKEYGCSRCRHAKLGCKTCRQPGFKPRAPRKKNNNADSGAHAEKGEPEQPRPEQPRKRASKSAKADGEKAPPSRKRTKMYHAGEIPDVD